MEIYAKQDSSEFESGLKINFLEIINVKREKRTFAITCYDTVHLVYF